MSESSGRSAEFGWTAWAPCSVFPKTPLTEQCIVQSPSGEEATKLETPLHQALKLRLSIMVFMRCSCYGRHFAPGEASERRVSMRTWILAASLIAAAGAASTNAKAADLDEGPPPNRYGSVYDDPRYADVYRRPEPPYAAPVPRERIYRDNEVAPPYARPDRYSYNYDEGRPAYGGQCVPREVIRAGRPASGW